ncbi:MAG: glycerol-3-phosphate 1-O-acyltransferase PlsY [Comamonas sp.]
MNALLPTLATVVAYLIGSLSFAVIVSRAFGLNDPRTYGSGNPGATNVLRSGSKKAAAVTLLLDALKGFVPVVLVKVFGPQFGLEEGSLALVAIAAFLGHLFPVFFQFKGGKGVATALGVLLGISGWLGLFVLLTWLAVALITRYSSLSALIASIAAPVYYVLLDGSLWSAEKPLTLAIIAMSALLLWRHAQNIGRLLKGQESKIGSKKDKTAAAQPAKGKAKQH